MSVPILAPTPRYPGLMYSPPPISGTKRRHSASNADSLSSKPKRLRLNTPRSQQGIRMSADSASVDGSVPSTQGKGKRGSRAKGLRPARTETLSSLRAELSELKMARVESHKLEQARNVSHAEALQRETNLRNLLAFKDKQLADLRNQQSSLVSSKELLDLRTRLQALEQAKQDNAEAADAQYQELKDRSDAQLEELQRAVDMASGQQLREVSTSENHHRTIEDLNSQLESLEVEHGDALGKYQELEKEFRDASQKWQLDEEKCQEDHKCVVNTLHDRVKALEDAYAQLGSDSRDQRHELEDNYKNRIQVLEEDHKRSTADLKDRVDELQDEYTKVRSNTQNQLRELEDRHKTQLQALQQQTPSEVVDAHDQHLEDLEHQLASLREIQDLASRDRRSLEEDFQKQLAVLEKVCRDADASTQDLRTQVTDLERALEGSHQREEEALQVAGVQHDISDDLQSRISNLQVQHNKDEQDAETRMNEVHQQLNEARHQLNEAQEQLGEAQKSVAESNLRYQELQNARQETPASTVDVARVLETAISDAQREAEATFNSWKVAHDAQVQV